MSYEVTRLEKCDGNPVVKALDSSRYGGSGYGMCEGDCDKDSDCDAGLKCFQRDGYEIVPGCSGSGKKGWDYCVMGKQTNPVPVGRISDEELQFHYKFICTGTTGNPGSLVIDFPRNTLPGKYEVLVNAGLNSGPKVVDGAGNKVKKEVFTTLVGCSEKEIGPPLFAKSAELGDTSSSTSTVDSGVLKMNVFLIAYAVACSVWCIFTTFKNARLKNTQATDHELHENIPILDENVSDVAQKPAYGSVI
jgi:hypothetical protein